MMREANKLKQSMKKYNWEFVKYTAKLKLKQNEAMLQMNGLRKDQSEIQPFLRLNNQFAKVRSENYDNADSVLESEENKIALQKSEFLEIHVLENFVDIYREATLTSQDNGFLTTYARTLGEILNKYVDLFEKNDMSQEDDFLNYAPNDDIYIGASFLTQQDYRIGLLGGSQMPIKKFSIEEN